MLLARVIGHVVATRKHPSHTGFKTMVVRPVDPAGAPSAPEMLAVDTVSAGEGDLVLVVIDGRSAGEAVRRKGVPLDAAIVGIVDRINLS
jgi:ethanolamine utilization protein EutN